MIKRSLACRIQGAGAYLARELIVACPCVPTMIGSSPAVLGVIFWVISNFGEWLDQVARSGRSWKLVIA
jgi:hypothetical protein